MDTSRRFAYKIIFYETTPSSIPSDMSQRLENVLSLNPEEPNICPVCEIEISLQLSVPITMLVCKHTFRHDCIVNRTSTDCPICEMVAEPKEDDETNNEVSSEEVSSEEESSDGKILEETPKQPIITCGQKIIQGLILELSVPTEGETKDFDTENIRVKIEVLNENIARVFLVGVNDNPIEISENIVFKNETTKNKILTVLVKNRESYLIIWINSYELSVEGYMPMKRHRTEYSDEAETNWVGFFDER
nr:4156_t:CDS:2 [Entrophospora candida]